MAASSKPRQRVSTLLPIAEHRQAKVCDSSSLDEATFSTATAPASAEGKSSSGYGKKVVRPIVKLKKAFMEMLVSEQRSPGSVGNGSAFENPAHWSAFTVGLGMVPITYI